MKRKDVVSVSQEELDVQKEFIDKIQELNNIYFETAQRRKTFYISTFGCQMNVHDSEKLSGMLHEMGYVPGQDENTADVIVYNTCCVRENAENKVYGNVGHLKHVKQKNPDLKIVLCGCMMQQKTVLDKIKQAYNHVDVIFGTFNLHRLPQLLYTNMETGGMIIDVWEHHKDIADDLPVKREYSFKAGVNIMYGCNNFCTYCIVPYVRGRERSREPEDILREIKTLADDGVVEVMLLGQNVNSYGLGLENEITFAQLLQKIAEIDGIERIRFMTSHPKDLSDELIHVIRDNKKICNFVHLPFQAGSTNVLKRMNRKYTKEGYLDLIAKIKKEIPDIGLTTDIIVGFPGETDEDFEDTLDIVRNVRFNGAFTFIYSKRTGTPAASMEEQVPEDIVKARFDKLLSLLNPLILEKSREHIGNVYEVLAEDVSPTNENCLTGRTDDYSLVHFPAGKELIGKIVRVKIVDCKTFYLIGELE